MIAFVLADHIVFEDALALVIDKPAGLPVDPPRDGGPSVTGLSHMLRLGFARSPMAVHRLDRDTSGCLLLARNERSLKALQASFANRTATKTYLAIVVGQPPSDSGELSLPLTKRSTKADGWKVIADPSGQTAQTRWELLAGNGSTSLLRLTPTTGRTHQLRVHCATGLGCPIVGDPVYGRTDARGMMLHASALMIPRPGKDAISARAPFPRRFALLGHEAPDG